MAFRKADRERAVRTEQKLDALGRQLTTLGTQEAHMATTLDELLADVADEATVIGSVETLLTNLSAQLAAAIASGDPVKLQAVKDAIDANKARLAADVAAKTPAAPTP